MDGAPLPPGKTGLPILGETLTLLRNGFAFVEAGARKHRPIFKTNIFFRPTAAFGSGPREFSTTLSIPFLTTRTGASALLGRIAFGLGAVMIDVILVSVVIRLVRASRRS